MDVGVLLESPIAMAIVPVLVIALIACIILKVAKGCIKFLIVVILLAIIVLYIAPLVFV